MIDIFLELGNKIKVYYKGNKNNHSFVTNIFVRVDDKGFPNGMSHFVEHISFKGIRKVVGSKFLQYLEGKGITINAFTSQDFICYEMKAIAEASVLAFKILIEMIMEPRFDESDIENEKDIVREEMKYLNNEIEYIVKTKMMKALWGDESQIGRHVIGTIDSIDTIDNYSISRFINEKITTENMFVSIYGNCDIDKIIDELSKIKRVNKNNPVISAGDVQSNGLKDNYHFNKNLNPKLVYSCLGYRIKDWKAEGRWIYDLINLYLGEGMSSKLFLRTREENSFLYEVWSEPNFFAGDSQFLIGFITSIEKKDRTLDEILETIRQFDAKRDINLNLIKNRLKADIVFSYDNPQDLVFDIARNYMLYGRIYELENVLGEIDSITLEQLSDVMEKLFLNKEPHYISVGY